MNFTDRILKQAAKGAEVGLDAVAEYFNSVRQSGFSDAVEQTAAEYANFKKDELEKLRHEHRRRLSEIKSNIEEERYCFSAWYAAFMVTRMLWLPLSLLVVIAIVSTIYFSDTILVRCLAYIAAVVFIADLIIHGLVRWLMKWSLKSLAEQYALHGIAEGMISLSDYRGLERFDLSKLPNISRASRAQDW